MTYNKQWGFVRVFKTFVSSFNAIATGWIFLMMITIAVDVIGRAFFNQPLTGSIEFVKVSLVGIVFMEIPDGFMKDKHIKSDLILSRVGLFYRALLNFLASVMGCVLFIGIFISSWNPAIAAWKMFECEGEGALCVPTYPIRTLIVFCSLMTAIILLSRAVDHFKNLITPNER